MKKEYLVAMVIVLLVFSVVLTTQAVKASDSRVFHFGFKKSKNGELASIDQEGFKSILQSHEAIFLGDTSKKELYLTFNNGYENGNTTRVLDVLKEKEVLVTFFLTGHYIKDQPELVKRMVKEGHSIGNHSWDHPDMARISKEKAKQELEQVKAAVAGFTEQQEMPFARPPSGTFSDRLLADCKEFGYTNVFWSIAYKDWDVKDQKGANYAYRQVMAQLHPGAVIMLHTVSKDNAEAMANIIDGAREQGYVFKSLDQLEVKNY